MGLGKRVIERLRRLTLCLTLHIFLVVWIHVTADAHPFPSKIAAMSVKSSHGWPRMKLAWSFHQTRTLGVGFVSVHISEIGRDGVPADQTIESTWRRPRVAESFICLRFGIFSKTLLPYYG